MVEPNSEGFDPCSAAKPDGIQCQHLGHSYPGRDVQRIQQITATPHAGRSHLDPGEVATRIAPRSQRDDGRAEDSVQRTLSNKAVVSQTLGALHGEDIFAVQCLQHSPSVDEKAHFPHPREQGSRGQPIQSLLTSINDVTARLNLYRRIPAAPRSDSMSAMVLSRPRSAAHHR